MAYHGCGPVGVAADQIPGRRASTAGGRPATDRVSRAGIKALYRTVACIGLFRSTAVASELDPVLHRSTPAVVWFQTGVDVPSGEDTDLGLRSICWEELAQDYEL
ncbi:hypothetical protein ACLMNJ_21795 [Streptomyces seoulensis]